MKSFGLFTRQDAKVKRFGRAKMSDADAELLGSKGVRHMNRRARHPNIQPTRAKQGAALLLLDYPTERDDAEGRHLQGRTGAWYRRKMRRFDAWSVDYVCRTLPPGKKPPTTQQVAAFRREVEDHIDELQPSVIVVAGITALRWISPGINPRYKMDEMRGRVFPVQIRGRNYWAVATFGIRRASVVFEKGIPDVCREDEAAKAVERDFKTAIRLAGRTPTVEIPEPSMLMRDVELVRRPSAREVELYAKREKSRGLYVDLETNAQRPHNKDAVIQTLAFSGKDHTIALPVRHPEVRWTKQHDEELKHAVLRLVKDRWLCAHNLVFDLEFLIAWCPEILDAVAGWECTQVAAYLLDHRRGQSLDLWCRLRLGYGLKGLSRENLWDEKHAVYELLKYNALDAKIGRRLRKSLAAELKRLGLYDVWRYRCERTPFICQMQLKGVPRDQKQVRKTDRYYRKALKAVERELAKDESIAKYNKRFPPFSITSATDVGRLFCEVLGHDEFKVKGKYKAAKEQLEPLLDVEPIAKRVVEHRRVSKLLSTNIVKYYPDHAESYIYDDGLTHSNYYVTEADGGRLACRKPNDQNVPNRGEGRRVRSMVRKPDHMVVSIDLGQIEARVLAMISKDKNYCKALWDRYDIHMEWTEKFLEDFPSLLKLHRVDSKKGLRKIWKNAYTFPLFYGAGEKRIEALTKVPSRILAPRVAEFWRTFAGVKRWQKKVVKFYETHGFVESLTGTRTYAPLTYNKIINAPIQGTASDFTVKAGTLLEQDARELGAPCLIPNIQIHDDLTFIVPTSEVDFVIKHGVRRMLKLTDYFDFINVPLTCEVEVGPSWDKQETYGEYSSDTYETE
jgi:DNA polymerase I-like protein with 3'-5' exonuclease and polymerase domains